MFFLHALLFLFLGSFANASYWNEELLPHAYNKLAISINGGKNFATFPTWYYRLELPKDHQERDEQHHDDAIKVNQDGTVEFWVLGPSPGSILNKIEEMRNGNMRRIVGVWGVRADGTERTIPYRNSEMTCEITKKWDTQNPKTSGAVGCRIIAAKVPSGSSGPSDSPPTVGRGYYRIKPGARAGDIKDALAFSRDKPEEMPRHGVLTTVSGTIGWSNLQQVTAGDLVGVFRVMPSSDVKMEDRRNVVIVTKYEEDKTRKAIFGSGKMVPHKNWGFGKVKKVQKLRYQVMFPEPKYPAVPIPQPHQRVPRSIARRSRL